MKKAITLTLGTGIFLFATTALAQYGGQQQQGGQWGGTYQPGMPPARSSSWNNIGDEGQLVISVDRIMGLAFDSSKGETDTETRTSKRTSFHLFGVGGGEATGFVPRLALDFFPIESLSIGGSLLYSTSSGETETETTATSNTVDDPEVTTIGFAPRIGYAVAFDETFSVWPRAGITYISRKAVTPNPAGDQEANFSGTDLTVEVLLGISPFENFALGIGPYLDFPLGGSTEVCPGGGAPCGDVDTKLTSYGIMTSIMAYWSP